MAREAGARTAGRVALVAPAGAFAAVIIALVAVWRRWLEAAAEKTVEMPVMVPATALGVLAAAGALLLLRSSTGAGARITGVACAVGTVLLGLATFGQYAAEGRIEAQPGVIAAPVEWWAQRPGPATSVGLAFLGASLSLLSLRRERARRWSEVGAAAALSVALTALVGHAYGTSLLYGLNRWGGTSVSTATALIALGAGVLFFDPGRGFAALSVSSSAGGRLIRRLIPAALLAPPLLGWFAQTAQQRGLVDAPFATALLTVLLSLLLVGLVVRHAVSLHVASVERDRLTAREREAGERVTNILESITNGFFAVDREWRFTYANREAERLLNRSREELVGRNVWAEFPEAVGAAFQREYERAMQEQKTVHFEAWFEPLARWFDVQAFPSSDGLSVYFRDVTARKRAEERLRESEQRYRTLADMIPQHIWITDPTGYHNYFSRRWFEFSGTTLEQTQGEGWLELLHPDDRARTIARWEHSLRTGEPYAIEYRFRRPDGNYFWFLGQAMPLRNEAGEIVQWFGTLTDISERKRLEEEREQLLEKERQARAEAERRKEDLERVTESRASLMRGFSHDVKNSLNVAQMSAELVERGKSPDALSPKQREGVVRIRRSIRTSLRLIDDLLELARAEAGQLELECVETDVAQLARDLAEEFRASASAAGLSLHVSAPEDLPGVTDPARLHQILANLLSNTVKYASPGRVTILAEAHRADGPRKNEWIAISVSDSGPGIPEDKQEAIFEEYTRLDPKASSGAGIGLAISRRIARLLGGDLTVESEEGRGATFTLLIPAECGRAEDRAVPLGEATAPDLQA